MGEAAARGARRSAKKDLDHDALHAQAVERFSVDSIAVLTEEQLRELFRGLAGRPFRAKHPGVRGKQRRQAAGMAGRKGPAAEGEKKVVHLATTADRDGLRRGLRDRLGSKEIDFLYSAAVEREGNDPDAGRV